MKLNHPHIMRILGAKMDVSWEQEGRQLQGDYLALELLCNGQLFDLIISERGNLTESHAKRLLMQMLAGLTYMHE